MREVTIENKKANRTLLVKGKNVHFKNGKAQVSEAIADEIEKIPGDVYTVQPAPKPSKPVIENPPKKAKKARETKSKKK